VSLSPAGTEWWQLPVTVAALILLAVVAGIVADQCYALRARRQRRQEGSQ
jgi:hypothetical protein